MRPETIANLQLLEDADWFSAVGVHDHISEVAHVLSSWDQALEHCQSIDWENTKLEVSNQFCERLLAANPDRFNRWNHVVREVKGHTIPLVRRKTAQVVSEFDLPRAFIGAVEWDILGLCMESEYVDICPAGFYSGQAFWYVHGHFPCGWLPEGRKGKPIIY